MTDTPLDWVHPQASASHETISVKRAASESECRAIAESLDILSCDRLETQYTLKPVGKGGHLIFKGTLTADVAQACVVSLEAVPEHISESFEIELVPEGTDEPAVPEGELEILAMPDVETYADGRIEAGRLVLEVFASALDPYPRKAGTEFDWSDPKEKDPGAKENPFAVLAKLKGETDG